MINKKLNKSAENQRCRLWDWLKKKPITTLEARAELDILMPDSRILELRQIYLLKIDLVWIEKYTQEGVLHRVGKYILRRNYL